jgi:hypothetical protein
MGLGIGRTCVILSVCPSSHLSLHHEPDVAETLAAYWISLKIYFAIQCAPVHIMATSYSRGYADMSFNAKRRQRKGALEALARLSI